MVDAWLFVALCVCLYLLLLWMYVKKVRELEHDQQVKHIMECQVHLLADVLAKTPSVLNQLSQLHFFPDQSGSFVAVDAEQRKVVASGDDRFFQPHVAEHLVAQWTRLAKHGGGYARVYIQGVVADMFVLPVPHVPTSATSSSTSSPNLLVGSVLFMDHDSCAQRRRWKVVSRCPAVMLLSSSASAAAPSSTSRSPVRRNTIDE